MIAKTMRKNLMTLAYAYSRATGKTLNQIGKKFYGRDKFLVPFREGKVSISIDKFDAVVEKFREHWPKGESWPYLPPVRMTKNPEVG